ncbi:DUF6541 family protein [Microbacterium flavum]|uniref:Uncharacterized protein n=1 Tax=Microbacterium flavum TaxID=415216 RepID=A0ABS5XUL3_9MICO|nr:DUF6541 family protein [Microbacterium flavum]MBT8798222.1 hypothetical protein [Microbacterium flavum]
MSWLSLIAVAVVTVVVLIVIGYALARIIGLRGFTAIAVAPAFTMTVIAIASVILPWVGVPWATPGVLVVAVVLGGVLAAARWATRRWRPTVEARPRPEFDAWLLVGLLLAVALLSARVIGAIQEPDRISQTYDNVFHLNAVRWVLDTGSASALDIGYMTNPAGPPSFYPSAWHGLVALVAQLTGATVPVAINGVVLAIAAVVTPLGLLLLTRTLFGRSPVLSIAVGLVTASVPLSLLLMDYGVLYPFQLGVALLPIALALTVRLLRLVPSTDDVGTLWWGIALLGLMPGMALVHPGGLMAWLALSVPMAVIFVVTQWRSHRSPRRRTILLVGSALYLVVGAAMVYLLRPPALARGWQPEINANDAVVRILTAHPWYPYAPVVIAAAVLAGVVAAVIRRDRAAVTTVGVYAVAAILYFVVAAVPFPFRDLFTAPWYNNVPRIAALLLVAVVPLAAFGLAESWRFLVRTRGGGRMTARAAQATAIAVAVAVAVLTQIGPLSAMPQAQRAASASFALTPDSPLLSTDEAALLARLDEHVPADAVIAGSPWTGTSVAYALTGRHVLMPHIQMVISDDLEAVNDDLRDATPGSPVCSSIADLGVQYVLDFGSREVHGATHVYPGLEDLKDSTAVRLVDSEGQARLYQVVGCER